MLKFLRQRRLDRARPDPALFERVLARFAIFEGLDPGVREALEARATEILAEKDFVGAGGLDPTPEDVLAVAILAALPVLELGVDWHRGFHSFILYPDEFITDIEEIDDDGLVHRGRDLRVGEAWANGPVVLAMTDVWASGQGEGYNVVVHELAHQLDQLNGDMDGFPPLRAGMPAERWTEALSCAYADLESQLERGEEPALDPYAAESPAEFFAVACEYYFDAPDWLLEQQPEVYEQLDQLFFGRPTMRA